MLRIDIGDAPPVGYGLRRTTLGFQEVEEAYLKLMVENAIIQPSSNEWQEHLSWLRKRMKSTDTALTTEQ